MNFHPCYSGIDQPCFIRGGNFVPRPKVIVINSIGVKLHKYVIRYVLEIYFPNFFNKTKIFKVSRDLSMTSVWNLPSIPRSNYQKIKSAVTLSKTDIYWRYFTRKYILSLANYLSWIFRSFQTISRFLPISWLSMKSDILRDILTSIPDRNINLNAWNNFLWKPQLML